MCYYGPGDIKPLMDTYNGTRELKRGASSVVVKM